MTATLTTLNDELNGIYGDYDRNFAGRPRATRDSSILSDIIARLESAMGTAKTLANGDNSLADTLKTANENLDRYLEEMEAIRTIQGDSRVVFAAELAGQANRVFDRYQRHYAGFDRATRDYLKLSAMTEELVAIEDKMAQLVKAGVNEATKDRGIVKEQIALYRAEIANIKQAQIAGTNSEKVDRYASLANDQFRDYRIHFSGKGRPSRRIGLLERMKSNLKIYRRYMNDLQKSGFHNTMNEKNLTVVSQNITMYEGEIEEVKKAKASIPVKDLAGTLGGAANEIFQSYRASFAGKDRSGVDADLLSDLCDGLYDIALQMRDISNEIDIESNDANLRIVEENLTSYENEYRAIKEAQGTK